MGDGIQFIDIIIFALIAVFLIMRLRGVLGRRDGTDGSHGDPFTGRGVNRKTPEGGPPAGTDSAGNVFSFPNAEESETAPPPPPVEAPAGPAGLQQIVQADPQFSPGEFLNGAKSAFEMILVAFAGGDRSTLKRLLSQEVYADFDSAIAQRETRGETMDYTLVGFKDVEISDASVSGRHALVTVRFVTDQVTTIRDNDGREIEGDASKVTTNTDLWTFSRDLRASDPNWTLVSTDTNE